MRASNKHLIVIAGPTAIGKTGLAVKLAKHYQTEVISADSRQFYRDMSIGTAKPTPEEMDGIPHHFVDFLNLSTHFNAGEFERQALLKLEELFQKHDVVIAAGGSGMYINALLFGLDYMPRKDDKVREYLVAKYEEGGIEQLQDKLKELDPEYYDIVDQDNPQRLIRAIEVNIVSGQSYMAFRKSIKKERPFHIHRIALNTDRDTLYERINTRVDQMVAAGLVDEALYLEQFPTYNALNTVGYKELFEHFDGKITLEEAVEQIKRNTRRFAKRQLTWFRKDDSYIWFEPHQYDEILKHLNARIDV